LQVDKLVTLKTIGIGESDLQQKLNNCCLPDNVQLGFRAATEEVQTKLLFPADMAVSKINDCVSQVAEMIGDKVFAIDHSNQPASNLVSVISRLMNQKQWSMSILETITQGLISAKCVGEDWLQASSYQQSIDEVIKQLGITQQDDSEHGFASPFEKGGLRGIIQKSEQDAYDLEKIATAIASKLKQKQQTDLVLIQLYQIDKSEDKKNNIILYNALLTPKGMFQETLTVSGSIKRKQNQAAIRALDFLRRVLQINASNTIK
jgi:molybdopterin-biosynthesis enzyme MoeA-like protein